MIIEYAKNPKWAFSDKSGINLIVKFKDFDFEVPYTATDLDIVEHSKELYKKAIHGEFGEINDCDLPNKDELAKNIRLHRNTLLSLSDWTQLTDVPSETKEKWAVYRQMLRDIPKQNNFPFDVVFPLEP